MLKINYIDLIKALYSTTAFKLPGESSSSLRARIKRYKTTALIL